MGRAYRYVCWERQSAKEDKLDTTETLTFEEFVDVMRERMFDADALFPSRLHDLKDHLLPEYVGVVPENW